MADNPVAVAKGTAKAVSSPESHEPRNEGNRTLADVLANVKVVKSMSPSKA